MAKVRIKRDDTVQVIAGKDRGAVARVLKVLPTEGKVVVEGVHRVKRHQRGTGEQPGGIIYKELPVDISNVVLWDAENNQRVKVAYQVVDDNKVRVNRKTGVVVDKA